MSFTDCPSKAIRVAARFLHVESNIQFQGLSEEQAPQRATAATGPFLSLLIGCRSPANHTLSFT